mmetsp:Transcript_104672/g.197236  ORF Transcript_104672/g.197236 Transcript_104672/m.197236 type:complete len:297 (+) Transcript_104672:823-1713(+)
MESSLLLVSRSVQHEASMPCAQHLHGLHVPVLTSKMQQRVPISQLLRNSSFMLLQLGGLQAAQRLQGSKTYSCGLIIEPLYQTHGVHCCICWVELDNRLNSCQACEAAAIMQLPLNDVGVLTNYLWRQPSKAPRGCHAHVAASIVKPGQKAGDLCCKLPWLQIHDTAKNLHRSPTKRSSCSTHCTGTQLLPNSTASIFTQHSLIQHKPPQCNQQWQEGLRNLGKIQGTGVAMLACYLVCYVPSQSCKVHVAENFIGCVLNVRILIVKPPNKLWQMAQDNSMLHPQQSSDGCLSDES